MKAFITSLATYCKKTENCISEGFNLNYFIVSKYKTLELAKGTTLSNEEVTQVKNFLSNMNKHKSYIEFQTFTLLQQTAGIETEDLI
jgi:hypothetical protein